MSLLGDFHETIVTHKSVLHVERVVSGHFSKSNVSTNSQWGCGSLVRLAEE